MLSGIFHCPIFQNDDNACVIAVSASEMIKREQELLGRFSEEELMEHAGRGIAEWVMRFFPESKSVRAYVGKGHNGGDALVALRYLQAAGWKISARFAYEKNEWAELVKIKYGEVPEMKGGDAAAQVLLDGLLGTGASGVLREPIASLCREMNFLREKCGAFTVALDLPTGVDADTGAVQADAVKADLTISVGLPKIGLLSDAAVNHVGSYVATPLPGLVPPVEGGDALITPADFPLPRREHDFHKGKAGRVSILAGSPNMYGAAVLAATSALRAGAGLVTLFTPPASHAVLAVKCPAEIMVRPCFSARDMLDTPADAYVVGPGLSLDDGAISHICYELLEQAKSPMVLDAGMLTMIASYGWHHLLSSRHVLTPHVGEFERLAPHLLEKGKAQAVKHFLSAYPCTLLLKGAHSMISAASSPVIWHNGTGHAGMASAGMGDVLSGVIASFMAQGFPSLPATAMAAWICGRAGEFSIRQNLSQQSLIASDIIAHFGYAFREWASTPPQT